MVPGRTATHTAFLGCPSPSAPIGSHESSGGRPIHRSRSESVSSMRSPRLPSARPSRRTLLLAIGGILGAVLLAAIVAGPLRPQPVTGSSPVFTMTQGWTLLELQRHLEAGDVTAVTATATPGAADARLVARLADGTLVPVLLSVAPEDAARSLAALGYGDRLTDEAWAA